MATHRPTAAARFGPRACPRRGGLHRRLAAAPRRVGRRFRRQPGRPRADRVGRCGRGAKRQRRYRGLHGRRRAGEPRRPGLPRRGTAGVRDRPLSAASRSWRLPARVGRRSTAAKALVRIEVEPLPPVLTIEEAIERKQFIGPTRHIARGDAVAALAQAEHRLAGELHIGGQEHFYLETQAAIADPRRSGGDDGPFVHAESDGDPDRRRPLPEAATRPGGLHLPADGRRLRRQGDAGRVAGAARGAGRGQDRPAGPVRPRPRAGLPHHRQAASVPGPLRGRLRCRRPDHGAEDRLLLQRRLLGRPVAGRSWSGRCCTPRTPTTFRTSRSPAPSAGPTCRRTRRSAASAGRRRSRRSRTSSRRSPPISASMPWRSAGEISTASTTDNVTPYGQVVRDHRLPEIFDRLAASSNYAERRAAAVDVQRRVADASEGHRPDAGEVRHQLHPPDDEPGQRAGQRLSRRHGAGLDRRHRDGPGAEHQAPADRRRPVRHRRPTPSGSWTTSTEKNHNTSPTAASASTDLNGAAAVRACEPIRAADRRRRRRDARRCRHRAVAGEHGVRRRLGLRSPGARAAVAVRPGRRARPTSGASTSAAAGSTPRPASISTARPAAARRSSITPAGPRPPRC